MVLFAHSTAAISSSLWPYDRDCKCKEGNVFARKLRGADLLSKDCKGTSKHDAVGNLKSHSTLAKELY